MRILKLLAFGLLLLALVLAMRTGNVAATTFTTVTSGQAHACALTSAGGALQCWGDNEFGALGIGTDMAPYDQSSIPLPVCASGAWDGTSCAGGSAFTGVYVLSQGSDALHSCATIVWGILECWGYNSAGQVGYTTSGDAGLNPGVVLCASTSSSCNSTYHFLAGITAIATGAEHSCALDIGGYVWCWGDNSAGELGDGTTVSRSTATRVCATGSGQDCPNGTLLSGVTAIAAGGYFSCALTSAGAVLCWGYNPSGQLGDGTTTDRSLPAAVSGLSSGVAAISAGEAHACALLSAGGMKCWGFNQDGELGDGTQTTRTTPVSVCASGAWDGSTCFGGSAQSGLSKVSAGSGHTCATMTSSPYVKCWGSQAFGQLGNGVQSYTDFALNPISWTEPSWGHPQPTALSAGGGHTCSIQSTYVECWGWNAFGQVGNGTTTDTTTWVTQDTDGDGCTDGQELGPNHAYGGQRDPTNVWDFFDTPDGTNTTLTTAIDSSPVPSGGLTISVASSAAFPAGPDSFYIDSEKFSYDTKPNSTSFHVTARALSGTTAASHSSGAVVIRNVRDRIVNADDTNRVIARYNSAGNPLDNPLLPPPPPPAYSSAFDRAVIGANSWNLGPGNGTISVADVTASTNQSGDSCLPTLIQKAHSESSGYATTISATFTSTPGQNHLLVAIVGTSTSVTINQPAGWSTAISQSGTPGQAIFYKIAGASEPSTATVTTGSSLLGLQIYEYIGVETAAPLDQTNSATGTSSSPASGSVTTTKPTELVIAAEVLDASTTLSGWSNSFNAENDHKNSNSAYAEYGGADLVVQNPGTYSTTATAGASGPWRGQIVTFRAEVP